MAEPSLAPVEALRRIIAGGSLSRLEMESLMGRLMDGGLSEPIKAALLAALATRGETAAEIAGAAAAMRSRVISVPHSCSDAVDTCGTGGDGQGTFNISTAAALVTAAAGVPVAKHGNRSVSSRSGSADVLAALGVDIEIGPERAGRALDEIGISFLFAPSLHPAMREAMPVRQELGVRTIFNVLGPLTNPAGARRQLIGVYAESLVETIGEVLLELGSEHAMVVHGADGLDEITTTGPTHIAEVRGGGLRVYVLESESLGLERAEAEDLEGGEPEENAGKMRALLAGGGGPLADITAVNAAAALYVGGRADNLSEGLSIARRALETGAAERKLDELLHFCDGE